MKKKIYIQVPTEAVKKLLAQVNKITDDGIKELRHYTETLEDSSDTANCFAKVYDAVKDFANRFGAVVDPEPAKPTAEQIKAAVLRYLDGKFETAEVVDDYRKVVVEGLQASYTNKEELRADVERIFQEGEAFFSDGERDTVAADRQAKRQQELIDFGVAEYSRIRDTLAEIEGPVDYMKVHLEAGWRHAPDDIEHGFVIKNGDISIY